MIKKIYCKNFWNIPLLPGLTSKSGSSHMQLLFETMTYVPERARFNKKLKYRHYQISNKANARPLLSPN